VPDTDELEHLNFSESVKIMSEAMKIRIRSAALSGNEGDAQSLGADDAKAKPGELGDLLKALKSAQQSGGLEKASQATVARLISDIQSSVKYNGQGIAGNSNGKPPSLLNFSA